MLFRSETRWDRETPPEPAALADAVQMVAASHAEYSRAARRRAVDRFDVRPWIQRHVEVFSRLVA